MNNYIIHLTGGQSIRVDSDEDLIDFVYQSKKQCATYIKLKKNEESMMFFQLDKIALIERKT